jgi:hypothetical protein
VAGVVVSESEARVGLADTVDALMCFAGGEIPVYALPRLAGTDEEKWRAAPPLVGLCDSAGGAA